MPKSNKPVPQPGFGFALSLPARALEQAVNLRVPNGRKLYENDHFKLGIKELGLQSSLQIEVVKAADVVVSAENGRLQTLLTLAVNLTVKYGAFFVFKPVQSNSLVRLQLQSKPSVSPDWGLELHTEMLGVDWLQKPSLKVAGVPLLSFDLIEGELNALFKRWLGRADENMQKTLDLRKVVLQAWHVLQRPQMLANEPEVWFKITPSGLGASGVAAAGNQLEMRLHVEGKAELLFSNVFNEGYVPLPELGRLPAVEKGMSLLNVAVGVEYAHLDKMLLPLLDEASLMGMKADSLSVFGDGEYLVAQADVSGSVKGSTQFRCIPAYNPVEGRVELQDCSWSLSESGKLPEVFSKLTAKMVAQKLKGILEDLLNRQWMYLKMELRKNLRSVRLSGFAEMKTSIGRIGISEIKVGVERLVVLAGLEGDMEIVVGTDDL